MGKLNGCILFIENDELLESYDNIWNRLRNSIKKILGYEPIYNKQILKTKIMNKNYYPKVFLRECKYTEKKCLDI